MPTRIEKAPPSGCPSVVLYLRDIKEIAKIIANATESDVEFADKEFIYDSLDELLENNGKMVRYLRMYSMDSMGHGIAFTVGGKVRNGPYSLGLPSVDKVAVYEQIADILHARRRAISHIAVLAGGGWPHVLFLAVLALVLAGSFIVYSSGYIVTGTVLAMCSASMALLGVVASAATKGGWSQIYLISPHEKPKNFFQRHWETIVIGVVMLIIGAGVKPLWDLVMPTPDKAVQQETVDDGK